MDRIISEELKPCPCCSGVAQFSECVDYVVAFCTNCGIKTEEDRSWPQEERKANVLRRWNLRNAPTALDQPTGGQVGEQIVARWRKSAQPFFTEEQSKHEWKRLADMIDEALRKPVETVGEAMSYQKFVERLDDICNKITDPSVGDVVQEYLELWNSLRTQPKALVVEVPSYLEILKTFERAMYEEFDGNWGQGDTDDYIAGLRAIHALLQSRKAPVVEVNLGVTTSARERGFRCGSMFGQEYLVDIPEGTTIHALLQSKGGR